MIEAITVERFRGIQHLDVEGFGRVNLIIGKNNCGKTALMEALWVADEPAIAAQSILGCQEVRNPSVSALDFERFWRPLFWNQDADHSLALKVRGVDGRSASVEFRKSKSSSLFIDGKAAQGARTRASWTIDVQTKQNEKELQYNIVGSHSELQMPSGEGGPCFWIGGAPEVSEHDIRSFSRLKQAAREEELTSLLREIDADVSGIELLSPSGTNAELFVRLAQHDGPSLPMSMMGEGFQRCFEIGVAAVAGDVLMLFIDEIDNGLHHSALMPVWRWLATVSLKRNLQVFVTTHSEECIAAAASAFTALNDDGLRVIRLDRQQDKTVAAVYNRDLVETAIAADVEIRG